MPAGPTQKFAPLTACMYCGSTAGLTDEHIVPAALDGNMVVPTSSCSDCARITSGFESRVLNSIRDLRAGIGMGNKRRKTTPRTAPIIVVADGADERRHIPIKEHHLAFPLPVFRPPEEHAKASATGIDVVGIQWISYGTHPKALLETLSAKTLRITAAMHAGDFARMLAKIAYSYAISQCGVDSFDEVFVLDAILGRRDNIGQWVFTYAREERKAADPNLLHRLNLTISNVPVEDGVLRAVQVHIQLFSSSPSPGYLVLVGSLRADAPLPRHIMLGTEPFPKRSSRASERSDL